MKHNSLECIQALPQNYILNFGNLIIYCGYKFFLKFLNFIQNKSCRIGLLYFNFSQNLLLLILDLAKKVQKTFRYILCLFFVIHVSLHSDQDTCVLRLQILTYYCRGSCTFFSFLLHATITDLKKKNEVKVVFNVKKWHKFYARIEMVYIKILTWQYNIGTFETK